ncbi:MAG: UV DNA damage repair endonuclease UvsE [Anaerolineae bacterium]|nr:UV DNA damage repair endonuclease UvsE [Anaerolineae bacterium]
MKRPAYLGFAVKVLGQPGLKSHDTRRWQSGPHLRVSLDHLRDLLAYLDRVDIRLYRIASGLVPYATHPDMPRFHGQVDECAAELSEMGDLARRLRLRLSFHPSQYIVLNAPDEDLAARSAADVEVQAAVLEVMGLDDEAVVVLHVGGVYGEREAALARFAARYQSLSSVAQRRLVVENDDGRFSVPDLLWLHERTGVRLVFDVHHHNVYNPGGMDAGQALRACLETWRGWHARPKLHFSSPRTDWGYRDGSPEGTRPPNWAAHAEFADPFAFAAFYRLVMGEAHDVGCLRPDVILEAKAKDVAVLQLRRDLRVYAPDVAVAFDQDSNLANVEERSV